MSRPLSPQRKLVERERRAARKRLDQQVARERAAKLVSWQRSR